MAKARILIVDDEDVARLSLLRILQLEGYEVTAVEDGTTAVDALVKSKFDLMILDLKMKTMGGMEVLEQIYEKGLTIKTIILTAYASTDTAIQAIRYKVVDYLIKPASTNEILQSVSKSLNSQTSEDTSSNLNPMVKGHESSRSNLPSAEFTVFHLSNGIVIDCMRRRIHSYELDLHLTPTEAKLLGLFLSSNAIVLRYQDLVNQVYGYKVGMEEAAKILRPIISRLNSKLSALPQSNGWIKAVRGAGYMIELDQIIQANKGKSG